MSSSARQEPPSALLQVLQAGEKILWWERCSRRLDGFATVLFLASIPPLIIYTATTISKNPPKSENKHH